MALVFFSYSHADSDFRDQLEKHLSMLKRQGQIEAWHDRKIVVGDSFDDRISEHLNGADIILLLVSSDFLASDYCYGVEVDRALERSRRGEARVIPVILRPCDWKSAPFGKLQATPKDAKPVSRWTDRDEAWLDVVEAIKGSLSPEQENARHDPAAARRTSQQATDGARRPHAARGAERPRSSNLRIRKEFSDADRVQFLKNAFEFMARFFENSLEELNTRNPDVESDFTRVDALQFTATVFRRGKTVSQCRIRLNPSSRGFGAGITFSHEISDYGNSFNEILSVAADDQSLFLQSSGMASHLSEGREAHLTEEGAAELYWDLLIERLQH